jgi:hypothetical protein
MAYGRQHARDTSVSGHGEYAVTRRNRYWEVRDPDGELVCLAVYKRGAKEVVRRMMHLQAVGIEPTAARL